MPDECFVNIWKQLVDVLDLALLSKSTPPQTRKIEQHDTDEACDMNFLLTLQLDVLIHVGSQRVPL
ncbi:10223_t:CDS:2 [Paraglomus brasilianum]|uniref:10223_t:CDS:1 n=1 Tax=Paraglomus brasilianum TaxID=144538 RepID=A0A9N9CZI1_9GLOM|nr:10223_t:CDS:2 [Paraglomus brasilianum]